MAAPQRREHLRVDLLLEIAARSDDVATVAVRFAAASKHIRRAILGTGFLRALANRAAANGGFNAALLLRFNTSIPRSSFTLVSSRDGLLVLWRHEREPDLSVCNTFTGRVNVLPCIDVDGKFGNGGIYPPGLLTVGVAGRSFELIVVDKCLRSRIFSSKHRRWGAIRFVQPPPDHNHWTTIEPPPDHNHWTTDTSAAVIDRTVHWICHQRRVPRPEDTFILALHADTAVATAIDPPRCYIDSRGSSTQLAATADGKLSLVIAESTVISMWTLLPEGWSRQVVISRQGISEQLAPNMDAYQAIRFQPGFGERSGTVLFWMEKVGLLQLNVGTKKVIVLRSSVKISTRQQTKRDTLRRG